LDINNSKIIKIMKKLAILLAIILLSSCGEDVNKHKDDFYWDEDFTLVDRKENTTVYDNKPAIIRTWVVQRNTVTNSDSIELMVINTVFENGDDPTDCGCNNKKFQITTNLWYSKSIGDKLHFDYIRKNRFFKKAKDSGVQFDGKAESNAVVTKTVSSGMITTTTTTTEQPTDIETQSKILELEAQRIKIEAEIGKLKSK
jgi:hypothetical protein